jgi:integrase
LVRKPGVYLSGISNKAHIDQVCRVLIWLKDTLGNNGYRTEILDIKDIGENEIDLLYAYLVDERKQKRNTFTKYLGELKTFWDWVIIECGYKIANPLIGVNLATEKTENIIIYQKEFNNLLNVISPETGWAIRGKAKKRRNLHRDYLKDAIHIGILTGCRAEELAVLKFSHEIEIENGVKIFKIDNLKCNRIETGNDSGTYTRYIPITKDLRSYLIRLGYNKKQGTDAYVVERPVETTISQFMKNVSRAFSHYIKQVTNRPVVFKSLRKTYITRLTLKYGAHSNIWTGHSDTQILKDHYISAEYLTGNLSDFEIFEEDPCEGISLDLPNPVENAMVATQMSGSDLKSRENSLRMA